MRQVHIVSFLRAGGSIAVFDSLFGGKVKYEMLKSRIGGVKSVKMKIFV